MRERGTLRRFEDFDLPLGERSPRGAYFVRVCGWSPETERGLWRFYESARQRGVILESLPNPTEDQIAAVNRALGDAFEPTAAFAEAALGRWMPALDDDGRRAFAGVVAEEYERMRAQGKPVAVMKNLCVKLMCWLNYRFGRLIPLLPGETPAKVLYAGEISAHGLVLLRVLWAMGADVLLAEPKGDAAYARLDPDSRWSQRFDAAGTAPFPEDFSLKGLRDTMRAREAAEAPAPKPAPKPAPAPVRRYPDPEHEVCTNAWMREADFRQILTPPNERGDDPKRFYNAYVRLSGARDRGEYVGELYRFYQALIAGGRRTVAVDGPMPVPGPEEVAKIRRRGRYDTVEEMVSDLAGNLPVDVREELLRHMRRAFIRVMEEAARAQDNLRRLTTSAVYLLCRVRKYGSTLFHGWREGDVPVFILLGGCANGDDALFVRWLSALPADVLLLCPDLEKPCALSDEGILDLREEESLKLDRFPRDDASLRMSTLAAHAQRDLDGLLYSDSDLYHNRQFDRAAAITLRTTFDELFILWEEELRYRQGFAVANGAVSMPVLFAKISGVEGGDTEAYWRRLRRLTGGDVFFVPQMPWLPGEGGNPYQSLALNALRGGRLNRATLRSDPRYPFALLREEVQNHILDKLQLMLERRLIRGTFVNGTEYAVVATVLNMDKALVRALQGFDFTRRNPKVVCVSTRERGASLEDAILMTFLNLAGFDILLFVPTGYQSVERYMAEGQPVEHQVGPYVYDLVVPDLTSLPPEKGPSWFDRLLGRKG